MFELVSFGKWYQIHQQYDFFRDLNPIPSVTYKLKLQGKEKII